MALSGSGSLKSIFSKRNNEDDSDTVEEEILSIVEEGHEHGTIQTDEAELISNVFEFGDKEAKDVMSPRQKIVGIEANTDIREALDIILDNSYSRYPIYEEDLDNIIGILHIKDAMKAYLENDKQMVRDLGSEPFCIHPTQKISKLFNEMQNTKMHLAIVVDEYGQTEGLVALEDLIEVIVGDILDEYDEEQTDIMKLAVGEGYIVNGTTDLEELEDLFHIKFPDEDIDTVNGFILYELGRLPEANEHIEISYEEFTFEAIQVEERMITKVRIRKNPELDMKQAGTNPE